MNRMQRALAVVVVSASLVGAATPAFADDAVLTPEAEVQAALEQLFAPKWGNQFLAEAVYHDIATQRGWSEDRINANRPFVMAVINRETGGSFCPNLRGGDQVDENCVVVRDGKRSGHYSDAGWGQANGVHYRNNGWMCRQEGLCSADDIIATPQASMTALVALIERSGKQPWCYDRRSRRSALCRMVVV